VGGMEDFDMGSLKERRGAMGFELVTGCSYYS